MVISEYGHEKINQYMLIYFVIDTCGGMAGEKMGMVNYAIQSMIPDIIEMSEEHDISTYIKVMGYGSNAYWMNEDPIECTDFEWKNLSASGLVEMGSAFKLLAADFERIKAHGKNFHPVIIWFSYRQPTDNYIVGLNKLKEQKWIKRTNRIAVTLGEDADIDVLKQFTGNAETILNAKDTRHLLKIIRPYYDGCAFDPDDYDYVSSFWELYSKKKTDSILASIIFDYPCVWENAKKMNALLLDYFPEDKLTRNLILSSVEEHIPHDLYVMKSCSKTDFHRFTKRLIDSHGCVESKAEEIIMLWIDALEISIENKTPKKMTNSEIANLSIDELELSVHAYNMLKRAGINTVGELMRPREEGMMGVRNLGRKSLEGVLDKIKALGWNVEDEEHDNDAEKNHPGRAKCDQLREIRKKIAKANDIEFEPAECHHTGPCMGTCPVCDSEIRYIDDELQKKKMRGEEIILTGLAADEIKQSGCNTEPDVFEDIADGGLEPIEMGRLKIDLPDNIDDNDWGGW